MLLAGSGATYARFIPHIKKNLDYGVVVFILTFNLVTVSSYRDDNVLRLAQSRMLNIAVGCMICLVMCLLVFPNWSGKYLQDSITSKLESLGNCIEVCVKEYFCESDLKGSDDGSIHDRISKDYKGVLDSKAAEDTLVYP
ncbi:aluminum-activated malate transporter 12-like [Arachis ipaensis]|uniref:aluminum-activated malate transporter 12-like n=1 Tax=Arachis ipaensis TaxID=130454 RepID=UPI000A2B33BB|nr:aluminum-activated malate transporter 12-like [Arachis ipaensis]